MRFLCLHGGGTNAEIFEIQLGGVTAELAKKGHSFTFINGRIPSKPQPEFENVLDGPFYNHYAREPNSPGETLAQAFEHTLQAMRDQGPFDGVIGFSQGAALACSMLATMKGKKTGDGLEEPLFKCAVFICAAEPFDGRGMRPLRNRDGADAGAGVLVDVPTGHILGRQDELVKQAEGLCSICEPTKAVVYDHGLGHKVPFDWGRTEKMVGVVDEVIRRACG